MTIFSIADIGNMWISCGGQPVQSIVVDACSISLAESGGNTEAISPSSDYGLFQINRIHFGDGTITQYNWDNPVVNTREAVKLSGGGVNWAAWCTAWADPATNCGHGFISRPQPGSAAYAQRDRVLAWLRAGHNWTGARPGFVTTQPQAPPATHTEWERLRSYYPAGIRQQGQNIDANIRRIRRIA